MTGSLALYAVVGLLLVVFGDRLRRGAFLVAAVPPAISTVWAATQLTTVVAGQTVVSSTMWVEELGLSLDLRLDGLALIMTFIVAGIGALTMVYAARYFAADGSHGRLAGLLVLFAGAMVGLAQADHLLAFYTFWELTTITSYLLIGNDHSQARARAAALHAVAATGTGGVALLGGFVLLGHAAGTFRITELIAGGAPAGPTMTAVVVLVLIAAFTKSAQYPFHAWLPGAMVAPTPVSAYLHSAAMVKAGVYLVALFAPVFATAVPLWRPLVLVVGTVTLIAGGLRALRQNDLKLLLAYGTVSQLGFLILLFGAGTEAATAAGLVLLIAHAMFKAALFMVVGILDRGTGTRDLRELPRLDGRWRVVQAVAFVSAASMAGVPLTVGFIAKESAYGSLLGGTLTGAAVLLAGIVAGSMVTAAYAWRLYWGAFVAPRRRAQPRESPAAPGRLFILPTVMLAIGSLSVGLLPGVADPVVSAALQALGYDDDIHLAVWHGLNLPLALSVLTFAGAGLMIAADRRLQGLLGRGQWLPNGQAVHLWLLRLLQTVSARVTAVTQNGSLPAYAAVILTTAAVLPLVTLMLSGRWTGWPPVGRWADLPSVALLIVAATGAATVRSRFSAAVFLGVTGYAMTALFVASGAPDLALTQAVVETLSTVVFVLVLRWLPRDFDRRFMSPRKVGRIVVATLVGGSVFVFALIAAGTPSTSAVSDELIARSVPEGHGRNVVNVTLVDFRALDTLGEITVLAAAAIGAVALARVGVRAAARRGELPVPSTAHDLQRVVFLDVPVRVIFYAVLLMSLWLLFAGHNQPGGGFVGGLLAGCAITLRYIAGGMSAVRGRSRFRPWTVLGVGLLLAGGTAAAPLVRGGTVLDVVYGSVAVPGIGDVTVSSALAFDAGVYVAVVGIVLMAFEAFGDEFPFRAR